MRSGKHLVKLSIVILALSGNFGKAQDKTTIPATLSASSIDIGVGDGVKQTYSLVDGTNVIQCGSRVFNMPHTNFSIVRAGGGTVSGELRLTIQDGKARSTRNATSLLTNVTSPAPRGLGITNMYEVAYKKSGWTTSSGEDFTLGASGSSTGFGGSVSVLVEYIDSNGGSGDSVVLEFEYSGTMNFGSSFANGSATNPSGLIITLYTDGVPEGFTRPAPGAGLEWDQDREFNNEVSGTITNNSSQDQRLEVWADQNGDGTPELIGYVTVSPGATAEVDIGVDLPPGTSVFLRASGETTGDSILTEEPGYNGLSVDMTFPPQEPYNVELVVENSTDGPAQIGIGNPDAPQDHLVFPPGTSTVQRVYQGTGSGAHAQTVTGGTTSHVSAQNGTTTQIVNVPGGGGSATVIGTATVPTGTGQQTAQIVQLPTGTQVTVGGGGGGNPVAPQTPQTGTGATGTGSSSSALTDAAAAQLAAIRAELSAAAGASQRPGEGDTEADLEAAKENIGEAVTGLQESTGQIRNVFEDLNPTLNLPTGIGKTSSVSISLLGKAYTLNFDHPAIVWFRSLILVGLSISWLIFLIKFAKT